MVHRHQKLALQIVSRFIRGRARDQPALVEYREIDEERNIRCHGCPVGRASIRSSPKSGFYLAFRAGAAFQLNFQCAGFRFVCANEKNRHWEREGAKRFNEMVAMQQLKRFAKHLSITLARDINASWIFPCNSRRSFAPVIVVIVILVVARTYGSAIVPISSPTFTQIWTSMSTTCTTIACSSHTLIYICAPVFFSLGFNIGFVRSRKEQNFDRMSITRYWSAISPSAVSSSISTLSCKLANYI